MAKETILVDVFSDGVIGPSSDMLGPVKDGGYIVANTAPGCWGPLLTPELKGGHEVSQPVAVEGAEVGDAIAIRIVSVSITSQGTSSGVDTVVSDQDLNEAIVAAKCPNCDTAYNKTHIDGFGPGALKCDECGKDGVPFAFADGYTVVFDEDRRISITLSKEATEKVAETPHDFMRIPDNSIQNPVVALAPHNLSGLAVLTRPFIGHLGTLPSKDMPDSYNAGDFASFLVGASHPFGIVQEELKHLTDGHMDINRVRAGAVLISPVKVGGGGVYVGDVHAMQGDGEIAGHTCDVSSVVVLQVSVIKGLHLDGPILLPVEEDLPHLARFLSEREEIVAQHLSEKWGVPLEKNAPLSFVGSASNLNDAISNALERAANVLKMSVNEVMNRATIAGGVEIGRAPGTVSVTLKIPVSKLKELGLYEVIAQQYCL